MTPQAKKNLLYENILSLFILQGVNYVLPLVTFPYLVRTLGYDRFGLLSFALSLAQYFVLITDYGYNLTATQSIARCKDDAAEVSAIYGTVMTVKSLLLLLSAIAYSAIVYSFEIFRVNSPVFMIMFLAVIGNVLFPVWLFQGLERMKLLSLISCAVKVLVTLMIFVLVRRQGDYLLAALVQVSGVVMSGLVAVFFIRHVFKVRLLTPSVARMRQSLAEGWYVFVSQISVAFFTNSNIFILGLFAPNATVGYFSIAEKIIKAVASMAMPITTAIYPRSSQLFGISRARALSFLRMVTLRGSVMFLAISALLFILSGPIVRIISGSHNNEIARLIRMMSILPLSVFLDNIWGTQIMLNIGMNKQFMYILLSAGLLSITASLVFVPVYKEIATSAVFTATELLLLASMVVAVRSRGVYVVREKVL